jgi:predicted nucleic acid-binding protein
VLGDHPEFVAEIVEHFPVCDPLTELSVVRDEPDNRFLECALAADAEFIVRGSLGTSTARGSKQSASRGPANSSRFRK